MLQCSKRIFNIRKYTNITCTPTFNPPKLSNIFVNSEAQIYDKTLTQTLL